MSVEAIIGFTNQLTIEMFLAASGFVSGDEQDRASLWVEGEGDTLNPVGCVETQFLHVGVARVLQCIGTRPS